MRISNSLGPQIWSIAAWLLKLKLGNKWGVSSRHLWLSRDSCYSQLKTCCKSILPILPSLSRHWDVHAVKWSKWFLKCLLGQTILIHQTPSASFWKYWNDLEMKSVTQKYNIRNQYIYIYTSYMYTVNINIYIYPLYKNICIYCILHFRRIVLWSQNKNWPPECWVWRLEPLS